MRVVDIVSLGRKKCGTNSSTLTDADALLYLKAKMPVYQSDVEAVNQGHMGSIEKRDLKATGNGIWTDSGTDYLTREYNLPADMIPRIDHVYACLDGTNFIELKEYQGIDSNVPFKETNIKERYTNDEGIAGYRIFRGSIMLLCGEIENDVTDGLEIWVYSFPDLSELTATSTNQMDLYGIPESMHELMAIDLSIEWKSNRDKPLKLTADEILRDTKYNKELKKLKGMNRSGEVTFNKPRDSYNNGFGL